MQLARKNKSIYRRYYLITQNYFYEKSEIMCFLHACLLLFQLMQQKGNTYKTGVGIKVYPTDCYTKAFCKTGIHRQWNSLVISGERDHRTLWILFDLGKSENFKWYIGPGAHVGLYSDKYYGGNFLTIGIDGVLGLDYKIKNAPLDISLDWQPSIEFGDFEGLLLLVGGVGVRFYFSNTEYIRKNH